jgi:hypothetical protein
MKQSLSLFTSSASLPRVISSDPSNKPQASLEVSFTPIILSSVYTFFSLSSSDTSVLASGPVTDKASIAAAEGKPAAKEE